MDKRATPDLGEHFEKFIETQIAQGRYKTADDVVRAGLQALEADERKLTALRAALDEGEASGPGEPFDLEDFLEDMHRSAERMEGESKSAAE